MFPGLNQKKLQGIMKHMGIAQEKIPAKRVIIENTDSSRIIIENPAVLRINMQGSTNFQVSGDIKEESRGEEPEEENSGEDIRTIIEKTGCTEEQAATALEKNCGDIAEAIISLGENFNKER